MLSMSFPQNVENWRNKLQIKGLIFSTPYSHCGKLKSQFKPLCNQISESSRITKLNGLKIKPKLLTKRRGA
jgi:hypothetical protein